MLFYGRLRGAIGRIKAPALFRSLSYPTRRRLTPSSATHFASYRSFSAKSNSTSELFNYTTGRWIYNDAERLAERRLVFDVDGLCQLAAESVGRDATDINGFTKLAEGGFNRIFQITFHDNFQMIARIPYPMTQPKLYVVASEVATMDLLASAGIPVPEVYGYAPTSDNAAKTQYIFMEYIRGTILADVWSELVEKDINSLMAQLTQLESHMMSIPFPAGGSLYYPKDLETLAGKSGFPLEYEKFCLGPDANLRMWSSGRRSQVNLDQGPRESAERTLVAAAQRELFYLEQFGQPILPLGRRRRKAYHFEEQSPSDHVENLKRYLLIAPSLVPRHSSMNRFCIRHPDLQPSNIMVKKSVDSGKWEIISLIDWQHTSILPLFLHAGIPQRLQNHNDPVSDNWDRPTLPENFAEMEGNERAQAGDLYSRRLVHYYYMGNTAIYNKPHLHAMTYPPSYLCIRLFTCASDPWMGETLDLKLALIAATEAWEVLAGEGVPCPIAFDAEDLRKTKELEKLQEKADELVKTVDYTFGIGSEGWIDADRYEEVAALLKRMREKGEMAAETEEEREEIRSHWYWGDFDEADYR